MVALVVFGARLCLIRSWGSPVPYWDQWDAEAVGLYLPWLRGDFEFSQLFAAHNEHRPVLTRLTDLGLFLAFGRWNPWAQLILNAGLHALTAGVVGALFSRSLTPAARAGFASSIALLFSLPAGWQNALWGFQSQFYFANLLSLAAIWGIASSPPFRARWWFGAGAALLAPLGNGGGLLGTFTALLLSGFALLQAPHSRPARWGGLILAGVALAALGFRADAPHHASLHAGTAGPFFFTWTRCLAWPLIDRAWLAVVVQAPLLGFVFLKLRGRGSLDATERCAIGLGLLAILHGLVIAFTRGGVLWATGPLSRYQDALALGAAAQLFLLLRLTGQHGRPARLALIGWTALTAAGLLNLSADNFARALSRKRALDEIARLAVQNYLTTRDPLVLNAPLAVAGLHPSNPSLVRQVLDDPRSRQFLPMALLPAGTARTGRPWLIDQSSWLTLVSLAGLLFVLVWPRRWRIPPHDTGGATA